jgi:hypothetical protein
MMEYLDQVRAGRAGVNPEGPLQVQDIGDRVGSEGVSQLLAAREAIVDLMVRVICESGIKPLMYQIRNQARKYLSTVRDYQFRGQWTPVLPSSWPERNTSTVMVGTGSGGTTVDRQAIAQIVQAHSAIAQEPGQTLVGPEERFNAWRRFCTLSGMPSASPYFVDPASPKGQQSAQQIQMQQQEAKMKEDQMTAANLDMQAKIAAAETGKAKAQLENAYLTNEVERLRADIERHKEAIAAVQKDQDLQFNYAKLAADQQMKLTELEAKERMELSKQHAQNKVANAKP